MTKELTALENIKRESGTLYFSTLYDIDMWREDFKTVETALKALEIIKKELCLSVKSGLGEDGNIERYLVFANLMMKKIDQEEFDLLKEVLESGHKKLP